MKSKINEILAYYLGNAYVQGATGQKFDLKPEPIADEILELFNPVMVSRYTYLLAKEIENCRWDDEIENMFSKRW